MLKCFAKFVREFCNWSPWHVPGHEEAVHKYRRAMESFNIDATKKILEEAIAAAAPFLQLQARNFKNTDIFKRTFVQNLSCCWRQLTGKRPTTKACSLILLRRPSRLSESTTKIQAATSRRFLGEKKFQKLPKNPKQSSALFSSFPA